MKGLVQHLRSSVGQKFAMAVSGLLLCGFLVVHLAGNVLLYDSDDAYNSYAENLHQQPWLEVAETGLFLLLFAHIGLGFRTHWGNRAARDVGYALKQSKKTHSILIFDASTLMFPTGLVILLFLALHMIDMKLQLRPDVDYSTATTAAAQARAVLQTGLSGVMYLLGSVCLGIHLTHGVCSAFQTLGIEHPKYNLAIRVISVVFGTIIALGFASFPITVNLGAL